MNILEEIAQKTRERIADKAKEIPLSEVREAAEKLPKTDDFPFKKALSGFAKSSATYRTRLPPSTLHSPRHQG